MTASTRLRSLLMCVLLLAAVSGQVSAFERGRPPPAVLGTGPDLKPLRTAEYAGRILVVTFWASWCGPCLNEMSVLERLQREAGERLAVVSINIEDADRFESVRRMQRLSLTLAHDTDGSVRKAWGVGPIPHLFMIDHEGRIAYEHRGYGDDFIPTLVDHVELLLKRRARVTSVSTP